MKKYIKNNIVVMLILVIFSIIFLNADYEVIQDYKRVKENRVHMLEKCKTDNLKQEEKELCDLIVNQKNIEVDFYTLFSQTLVWKVQYVYYLAFFIVVIPPLLIICKILKNKYIINFTTRESYNVFLKKIFKTAYKYIWVLPLLCLIMMIPLMLNSTLNPEYAIVNHSIIWESNIIYHPLLFVITYLIYIVILSITFINISLLVARKQQKFIPCILFAYIVYFAIEIFFETVVRVFIFLNIFKSDFGTLFNILNIFSFNDIYGVGALLLLNLSFAIISFILVYLAYRNKEKLLIQCEKNK